MIEPEFSRVYEIGRLTDGESDLTFEATADEAAKLAKRFDLEDIGNLLAKLHLTVNASEGTIFLQGTIEAEIIKTCVVTLKPIPSQIVAPFTRRYLTTEIQQDSPDELNLSEDSEYAPEPINEGILDFGEIIAEQLGLEIDPFPRSPGSEFTGFSSNFEEKGHTEPSKDEDSNPFAVLAQLKGPTENKS